jgi:protein-serine/threonine kinase
LKKDPAKRLGAKRGAAEIREHPFFEEIDWDKMMTKRMLTPYKPLLDSKDDTKHFDPEMANMPLDSPPQGSSNKASLPDDINNDFEGFSFVATEEQPESIE